MNRRTFGGLALGGLASACAYNEELGRRQLLLVSDDQLAAMSRDAWQEMRAKSRPVSDPSYRRRLEQVGGRVVEGSGLTDRNWDFNVFEGPVNAFALPGGQIGFYTGIFPHFQNDAQLAAVFGHEVGHISARHSAERASQQLVAAYGVEMASSILAGGAGGGAAAKEIIGQALGLGVQYGAILPFSRQHEYEADHLGAKYMAQAGYDPRDSSRFWNNFRRLSAGNRPPEYLSTHPADENRIAALDKDMPEHLATFQRRAKS
jgi:predicted Zn-dependent protease